MFFLPGEKNAGDITQGYESTLSHEPFCVVFLGTFYFEIILNLHENYNQIQKKSHIPFNLGFKMSLFLHAFVHDYTHLFTIHLFIYLYLSKSICRHTRT